MKILYLSCHSILEYDEVRLLRELGYDVFAAGAYLNSTGDSMRPELPPISLDPVALAQFHEIAQQHPGEDNKDNLSREFVENFDCILVMHMPKWIERNWDVMKHKRVIWRTIGQSVAHTEAQLASYRREGMEIVRYSPREVTIPGFIGQDALIRFYKDPDEY